MRFIITLFLPIVFASTVCSSAPPERIIWVTIDTLRADHLHYMGYDRETSPWLDEFAEKSADFRRAFSPSNVTRWSVSSFFTSKYCRDLVDKDPPFHIPRAEETIAEILSGAGYRTLAFTANVALRPGLGFEQGFDEYHLMLPRGTPHPSMDEVVYTVGERYKRSDSREFIYIQTMDVHEPWRPPMPFDEAFAPQYSGRGFRFGQYRDSNRNTVLSNVPYHSQAHRVDDRDTEMLVSQYDGSILYTDSRLGALFDNLQYDPARDTVIITSDHGEAFFEHGYLAHGKHLFPEETHVPLLIRGPGIVAGRHEGAVSLHDLLPTISELCDLQTPRGVVGSSLVANAKMRVL